MAVAKRLAWKTLTRSTLSSNQKGDQNQSCQSWLVRTRFPPFTWALCILIGPLTRLSVSFVICQGHTLTFVLRYSIDKKIANTCFLIKISVHGLAGYSKSFVKVMRGLKRTIIFAVRPTIHTNRSRERSFLKTLFQPEDRNWKGCMAFCFCIFKSAYKPSIAWFHTVRDFCPDLSAFPYISLYIFFVFKCLFLSQN